MMHTCQIMLVEANTVEEAFDDVESKLSEAPDWSDWHNAQNSASYNFAGRWTGQVFGTPDETGIVDTDEAPNYLQYSSDPALAERAITEYLEHRLNDIRIYQSKSIYLGSAKYDPYKADLGMDVWYTKKLAQLLNDEWTCDSGIFDLEYYSANLSNFIERVKRAPEKQWLIPVDFHF